MHHLKLKIATRLWTTTVLLTGIMMPALAQADRPITVADSLTVGSTKIYNVKDLYSLRPTYQMELDHFFTDKEKLIDCNEQLVKQVKKVKALKEFKYFETNGGFGIISNIKEVKSNDTDGGTTQRNFFQRLFGLGGTTSSCKRVYIFLVITNDLNEELTPNYTYLTKTYKTRQLERKWSNIATLQALLKNPENKYDAQQHSFVMRVYEFKKEQLAKEFKFVTGGSNYTLDPKIQELFGR